MFSSSLAFFVNKIVGQAGFTRSVNISDDSALQVMDGLEDWQHTQPY